MSMCSSTSLVDILPLLMFDQNSLENWGLCSVVVLDLEVCKEDDGGVGGEEDEDVPDTVEVGEAHPGPVGAEEPVVDPGGQRHADDADAPLAQGHDPLVVLESELERHQADAGDGQQHQAEGIHSLRIRIVIEAMLQRYHITG